MLDASVKVDKKEAQEYPPIPKDMYQAELLDISSEERPTYNTRNSAPEDQELETVMSFQFTLLEGVDGETKLRGRNVWANFIPTTLYITKKSGKNKLYRIIEALQGHEITPAEEAMMDGLYLNKLVGGQCRISIEPKVSGDKTFDNISDWLVAKSLLAALSSEEKDGARVKEKDTEAAPDDDSADA